MLNYKISTDAEKNLQDIARYTLNNWGKHFLGSIKMNLKRNLKLLALVM